MRVRFTVAPVMSKAQAFAAVFTMFTPSRVMLAVTLDCTLMRLLVELPLPVMVYVPSVGMVSVELLQV